MNYYKIILSRGEPLILDEVKVNGILKSEVNLLKIWDREQKHFDIINKAHIVQIYFDHEDNKQEYELIDGVYKLRKDIVPV